MQRSRRSLLQRRALHKTTSGRNQLYKVSLSLVLVLWGLVFLFSLWISRGHGYGDGPQELPPRISNWDEAKLDHEKPSDYADAQLAFESFPDCPSKDLQSSGGKSGDKKSNLIGKEESKYHVAPEKLTGSVTSIREEKDSDRPTTDVESGNNAQKLDSFSVPLRLDEFKSKAFDSRIRSGTGPAGSVVHRVEPGGADYNYASASKGAKILAYNKEAKGAANVLSRDKDKYLRNPCSAESKFVVIELSEETLVDTIEIANFEHHSSNVRDFELLGSLVYPTDVWFNLGNFTAANAKHAQRFVLQEPKWVRYVKLNLQTHYGSEFYCTLSIVEIYGVDAIEKMLEDLMYTEDAPSVSVVGTNGKKTKSSQPNPAVGDVDVVVENVSDNMDPHLATSSSSLNQEIISSKVPDPVEEVRHQVGRMPGDTVLKILMQKVRSMDVNLSVLERYLEELNSKYGNILKQHEKEMEEKDTLLQNIKEEIRSLLTSQEAIGKELDDLSSWKSLISMQLEFLRKDNEMLRSEVNQVREKQIFMENKGSVTFLVCIIFASLAVLRLFLDTIMSVYKVLSGSRTNEARKFCSDSSSWLLLLLSCTIVVFVQSL